MRGIFSLHGFSVLLEFIHFASRLSYFVLRAAFLAVSRFTGRTRSTSTHVSSFRWSDGISSPLESRLGLSEFEAALTHLATPLLASTFNLQPSTFHIPPPSSFVTTTHLNTTQLAASFSRPILHPPQAKQAKMASLITTTKTRRSSSSSRKGPLSHGRGGAGTSPPLLLFSSSPLLHSWGQAPKPPSSLRSRSGLKGTSTS